MLLPTDLNILATAVADTLVVATDPVARQSGLYYWEMARPWTTAVAEAVPAIRDDRVRTAAQALLAAPADPARYAGLREALLERSADPATIELFELAWRAEENSRVGHHLGARYRGDVAHVAADELLALPPGPALPGGADPEVLVVIPFREHDEAGRHRLRNLLACLRTLRDQSAPRSSYRVTVVECDDYPRWREVIEPRCDHYLFAVKPDKFNRSWGANTGVVNSPGRAEIICVLDADVLADRDFIARNVARFANPGIGGHLPYRDMFCLDPAAASWAIRERLQEGAAEPAPDGLRGFLLRRPPGCCMWVRGGVFHRVGGMDERYEGWGGEDNDFAYRLDMATPVDSFTDRLLHLHHPPVSELKDDGELVNAHIPPLSWQPDQRIGRLDRFAPALTAREVNL
jgi:hypothetical protein